MGLRDEITADIAEAFNSDLADAAHAFTGSRITVGDYNPLTETYDETVLNIEGRGVFGSFSTEIIDDVNILRTDVKLLVLQAELIDSDTELTVTPAVDDVLDGKKVIAFQKDPANVTWVIQLRKT